MRTEEIKAYITRIVKMITIPDSVCQNKSHATLVVFLMLYILIIQPSK